MKLINEHKDGCPVEIGEGVTCRAGSSSFWVTWDGKMLPCGMMTKPVVYPLETGFDAAWEQLRTATKEIRMPSQCISCDHKELCGVCAAVCFTETGRFDGVPDYVCEKTREQVRITQEIYHKTSHQMEIWTNKTGVSKETLERV